MKKCIKCNTPKALSEFAKDKQTSDGYYPTCKECKNEYHKNYRQYNKEKIHLREKQYRNKNKKRIAKKLKAYRKNIHWKFTLYSIKQRCTNPTNASYKDYGGRGVKCLISENELKELWFRDKAYLMKKPSIDRKDNDGYYEYDNCQFMEMVDNGIKDKLKKIKQYDLNGRFIREWNSIVEACGVLKLNKCSVGACVNGRNKTAGGFVWK